MKYKVDGHKQNSILLLWFVNELETDTPGAPVSRHASVQGSWWCRQGKKMDLQQYHVGASQWRSCCADIWVLLACQSPVKQFESGCLTPIVSGIWTNCMCSKLEYWVVFRVLSFQSWLFYPPYKLFQFCIWLAMLGQLIQFFQLSFNF